MHEASAILHVDGDSFFASCEVALNPRLKGKPVVTGLERGIASAMTYEAKSFGVRRGMPIWEIKKVCPEAIILPSDYETYSIISKRMLAIVARFAKDVEEYSIDECFAKLSFSLPKNNEYSWKEKALEVASLISADLEKDLGATFSLGVSESKVLAKIASKWKKPRGLTVISKSEIGAFLENLPIGKVWGIGPATSIHLSRLGIKTALDFALKNEHWVVEHSAKPYLEIWHELNGRRVFKVHKTVEPYQSISKTRTFTPPSASRQRILSELSKNVENACIKMRRHGLSAGGISFYIKTQDFKYFGDQASFRQRVSVPEPIFHAIRERFEGVYKEGALYRATGVTLHSLQDSSYFQPDLFLESEALKTGNTIHAAIDVLRKKYGKYSVFLASSMEALQNRHEGQRGERSWREKNLFPGESPRKRLGIPSWGEVG